MHVSRSPVPSRVAKSAPVTVQGTPPATAASAIGTRFVVAWSASSASSAPATLKYRNAT